MHVENLKTWLNGGYVSPPDFKDSLAHVIKDYERLLEKENTKDYKVMTKGFIGETIKDFFCNGFFGSRNYDLTGAEIMGVYEVDEDDTIVIEVKKTDGKYSYGFFEGEWNDWETVYAHLEEWTKSI
ncbi:MAG: hypothetical protein ABS939_13725 [Psychrobacillus sp.]